MRGPTIPTKPFLPPARPGLWRRTPPAIFSPIMGLFGLGLAWRRAVDVFGLPPGMVAGVAEIVLGAVTVLYLFALLAYGAKVARRPQVVIEDLRILPGRAGLASLVLSGLLMAAVLAPYAPGAAGVMLVAGLLMHAGLAGLIAWVLLSGPAEARVVTPVWHLTFVGFIIAGIAAPLIGWGTLGPWLLKATIPVAAIIWMISGIQLVRRIPPAPLRPLLAIHLAPASLFATVSALSGLPQLAVGFAVLGLIILAALVASARWITAAGFSAMWGAFTFPLAAYASALLAIGGDWSIPGGLVLIAATLSVPPIALKILQAWAKGGLAAKTNAATA